MIFKNKTLIPRDIEHKKDKLKRDLEAKLALKAYELIVEAYKKEGLGAFNREIPLEDMSFRKLNLTNYVIEFYETNEVSEKVGEGRFGYAAITLNEEDKSFSLYFDPNLPYFERVVDKTPVYYHVSRTRFHQEKAEDSDSAQTS